MTAAGAAAVGWQVKVTEVGVYVADSYDFNGDQPLRYWDDADNSTSMINPLSGTAVSNQDFRDWRTKNNKGGDFLVFSNIERTVLAVPYTFSVN